MAARVKFWKGAYWVFVRHNGLRKVQRVGTTKADKARAERIAEKVNGAIALGTFDLQALKPKPEREPVPFKTFAQRWVEHEVQLPIEREVEGHLAPSTARSYEEHVRVYLSPYFGLRDVRDLMAVDVQGFYEERIRLARPKSARTRLLRALVARRELRLRGSNRDAVEREADSRRSSAERTGRHHTSPAGCASERT